MKPRILKFITTSVATATLVWTGVSLAAKPTPADETAQVDAIAQMNREEAEIGSRLKMSAPLELHLINGKDPLGEAIDKGLILDVTLEEAEAAIQAAAATPDPEDDTRASELAHRGSFRFFPQEQAHGGRVQK